MQRCLLSILLLLLPVLVYPASAAGREDEFSLYFRWGKSCYDPDYLNNAASLKSLIRAVDKQGIDSIKTITVTTYASPEGVYECNVQLSRERMREVRWLMKTNLPDAYGKMHFKMAGEAWFFLRARVAQDTRMTEKSRDRILRFLDDTSISDDTRKWRLAHWLGSDPKVGDLYKYLLRTHYRYLRSGVLIVVETVPAEQPGEARLSEGEPSAAVAPKSLTDSEIVNPPTQDSAQKNLATTSESATNLPRSEELKAAEQEKPAVVEESKAVEPQQAAAAEVKPKQEWLPLLGISTNLLYDLCYVPGYGLTSIPSFSLEYYPKKGRFTFGADVEWPMWQHEDTHKYMQINNISLWARRWFKPVEDRFKGLYMYAGLNGARYGVGWDGEGWKGEGLGASLGIGHKWLLGKSRFFVDAGLGLGVFWSGYDPYYFSEEATGWYYYDYNGMPEEFHKRSKRLLWFGPTRAYISIGFDINGRKRR